MSTTYPPPVSQLLELGGKDVTGRWMDYLELGVGPEHVPDLVRMATDEQLNQSDDAGPEMWAPMHAWRALGQLRAESAVEPLLELAGKLEDELFTEPDLALVFGKIGRAAIPPLARVLADDSRRQGLHVLAVRGLEEIAMTDETARDEVVPLLVARLEEWERNSDDVNAFLVDSLAEMGVVEAAPLMEQAFAADRVDLLLRGDWEDVQIDLGLIEERREQSGGLRGSIQAMREAADEDYLLAPAPAPAPESRPGSPSQKAKNAKRKQQKESRKKNRRRK